MRSAIIKKASQDEQQNQTTITTNTNYNQNFMSIKKNLLTRSKKRQIKLKLNKITCTSLKKI